MASTKKEILIELRNTDKPACSASNLADRLDVSVKTIHKHIDDLVEEDKIEQTQIGNAQAYYLPFDKMPSSEKPDFLCKRCGREIDDHYDFARVDINTFFDDTKYGENAPDFEILCRFCYDDLFDWIHDPGAIGEYQDVHSWNIPTDQLQEVQEDDDIVTAPTSGPEMIGDVAALVYEYVDGNEGEEGVYRDDIVEHAMEHDLYKSQVEDAIRKLKDTGYIHMPGFLMYKTAK